jgi:hypothetical protein
VIRATKPPRRNSVKRSSRGLLAALSLFVALVVAEASAAGRDAVRFATYNASLNRFAEGQLVGDLSAPSADTPGTRQAKVIAEVVQRLQPDVLLINEFDFVEGGVAGRLFRDNYLAVSQNGAPPANYPYFFVAPSNTGIHSGFDLNNNGAVVSAPGAPGYGDDAFGFGEYPGRFAMIVYSKYPILASEARTFQLFRWKDMPGALLPDDPSTPAPADFYSPAELNVFRLSSKSHWDVPIQVGRKVVHFLVSHPTPPVFDGPEDRNGRRNFDEIRFWADYISPGPRSAYIYDDQGRRGGLKPGSMFVIAGDQNSDPLDGDSIPGSIQQLLDHPLVNTRLTPSSPGGVEQALLQDRINDVHKSDPAFDTADFSDSAPGNLRADYVLPRKNLQMLDAAVFWPLMSDPLFRLIGVFDFATRNLPGQGFPSSDHRPVWIDVGVPAALTGSAGR